MQNTEREHNWRNTEPGKEQQEKLQTTVGKLSKEEKGT
jgi:hypothetical protein